MRQFGRMALTNCTAPLPLGKKYVAVTLLTRDTLFFIVDVKDKGQDLLPQVCNYLGLNDPDLFGLALHVDGEYLFIDPLSKLSKYAPKAWKSQHGMGIDSSGKPHLTLHLRVQFYVDCHLLICDKVARHHYYLQLRENVVSYCHAVGEERAFLLAGYALQADLNNYSVEKHAGRYFNPYKYFPSWIIARLGADYIIQHIPAVHQDNIGMSRGEAQVSFIKEASDSTAPHNHHLYRMWRKKGKVSKAMWLGICAKGLEIYEENGHITKKPVSSFPWSEIGKLCFEKKKFEIRTSGYPEQRRFTYYTSSEIVAKNLLWLCRIVHQFHMATQPRLQELKKLELEGKKTYRESYIYSDSLDLAWQQSRTDLTSDGSCLTSGELLLKKGGNGGHNHDQRVSVISNASSNTTSGIVSDKVQGLDESEDDPDVEIMINCPPVQSADSLPRTFGHCSLPGVPLEREKARSAAEILARLKETNSDAHHILNTFSWSPFESATGPCSPTSSLPSSSGVASCTGSMCSSTSQLSALQVPFDSSMQQSRPTDTHHYLERGTQTIHSVPTTANIPRGGTPVHTPKPNFMVQPTTPSEMQRFRKVSENCSQGNQLPEKVSLPLVQQTSEASLSDAGVISSASQVPKSVLHRKESCCEQIREACASDRAPSGHLESQLLVMGHDRSELDVGTIASGVEHALSPADLERHCAAGSKNAPVEAVNLYCQIPVCKPVSCSGMHHHHHRERTATRIGVSSLTRAGRTPLTLYAKRSCMVNLAGSEPNLCSPKIWSSQMSLSDPDSGAVSLPSTSFCGFPYNYAHYGNMQSATSFSACNLHHLVNGSPEKSIIPHKETPTNSQFSDIHGVTNGPPKDEDIAIDPERDFSSSVLDLPFIPPPPAYRNTPSSNSMDQTDSTCGSLDAVNITSSLAGEPVQAGTFAQPVNGTPSLGTDSLPEQASAASQAPTSPAVLDLHQLRQKSRDLDLPLISALCNDRSLLMLPKTVPTCSRQRHMAGSKDLRRFSCSYVPPPPPIATDRARCSSDVTDGIRCILSRGRPVSWHLDSVEPAWLRQSASPGACQNGAATTKVRQVSCAQLPPTILTSFSKTPDRVTPDGCSRHSISPARQMIPTKLSSGLGDTPMNGRILAKGQAA